MRRLLPVLILPNLLWLAACSDEPENIQAKAENKMRELERRADEITAEAENDVAAEIAPLDDEANALLDQIGENAAAGVPAANAQ
jgi:F0F1-type ATP synthase membrane subunit b/b'